ncbi:hypothetical protein KKB58_01850 [Patescibacteria group bacterium]|nr:hypothetical protein [Patescibacteria group bacterium]
MKKFLPKILISFIAITILLAPVSPVFEKHNGHPTAKIEINKTHAATISQSFALPTISILSTSAHQFRAQFKITTTEGLDPVDAYNELSGGGVKPEKGILFFIYTKDKEEIAEFSLADLGLSLNISKPTNIFTMTSDPGKIDKLEPEKTYYLTMMIYKNEFFALVEDWSTWDWIWSGFSNMGEQIDENAVKITAEFTTKKTGDLGDPEYTA